MDAEPVLDIAIRSSLKKNIEIDEINGREIHPKRIIKNSIHCSRKDKTVKFQK